MRQRIWLIGALVLLAASCGGEAATTTAATAAAPASSTTTVGPTTTTEDAVAYRLMLATILAGEWVGEWQNATSGDRGAVLIGVRVDTAGRTATITIDLGGEAFGQPDPAPFAFVVDLSAALPYAANTALLGPVTFSMTDTGSFTLEAAEIPGAGVAWAQVTGDARSESVEAGYTVGLADGSIAEGRFVLGRPAA